MEILDKKLAGPGPEISVHRGVTFILFVFFLNFIYLSIYLFIYLIIYLFICLFIYFFVTFFLTENCEACSLHACMIFLNHVIN